MHEVFWLKKELLSHFPGSQISKGVDLNGDGELQINERTDINGDHEVDANEWQRFLLKNENKLNSLGGFFKYYFKLGKYLSPDNSFHNLVSVEHTMFDRIQRIGYIDKAYYTLWVVLERVKGELESRAEEGDKDLSPQEKVELIYESISKEGIKIGEQDEHLFLENINDPEGPKLDCDTSAMIAIAVAHEMGWPVKMVVVPGHAFVRWDDGEGTRFNFDNDGVSHSNEWYEERYGLEGKSSDYYMKSLDSRSLLSLILSNRAMAKVARGDFETSFKDINAALESDPDNYFALYREGVMRFKNKDYAGAARIFELYMLMSGELDAERLDRVAVLALVQGGIALFKINNYEGAMNFFMIAFRADERKGEEYIRSKGNPELHYYLGKTRLALGDPDGALENFRISWGIDKCRPYALVGMGDVYMKKKRFAKARAYYTRALKKDPRNPDYLKKMGMACVMMTEFSEATKYLTRVIDSRPDDVECLIMRGLSYAETGELKKSIADLSRALELEPDNEQVKEQLSLIKASLPPAS